MPFDPLPKELTDQAISEQEIPAKYRGMYRKAVSGKSRKTAINVFCLHCMGWDHGAREAVAECSATGCPLWVYRPYQDDDTRID
jgi:hypothetical protein